MNSAYEILCTMLVPEAAAILNDLHPRQEHYAPCLGLPQGCDQTIEKKSGKMLENWNATTYYSKRLL